MTDEICEEYSLNAYFIVSEERCLNEKLESFIMDEVCFIVMNQIFITIVIFSYSMNLNK